MFCHATISSNGLSRAKRGGSHQTLDRGLEILRGSLDELEAQKQSILSGNRAFEMYDTFGFPLDLTQMLARERNFAVDEDGFAASMSQQRERSRADWKVAGGEGKGEAIYADILKEYQTTTFWAMTDPVQKRK